MTRLCLFVLMIVAIPAHAPAEQAGFVPQRPNIVLLVADDLGYGELGCQGNPQIPTPHIDSIADAGVRFTDGYVTAAYCSASRAGLMTGRYQTRFGYEFNPIGHHNEDPRAGLPATEVTLAQHLHAAGYTTALCGKWHLGGHAAYHPLRRGFDEFFGFLHEGHYFARPPYRHVTTMLRRKALPAGGQGRWTSDDGRLVYSTHMGHDEPAYDANNPILRGGQPVEEREYLTDALTREAVDFIQGDVFEGGIRVPFMVKWPATLPAAKVDSRPVIALDIFATAAAVAHAPLGDRHPIDGVNLIPYLDGTEAGRPHDVLFWRLNQKTAVRVGDWKLLNNQVKNPRREAASVWELYNLGDDLGETRNLAEAEPAKTQELLTQWEALNSEMIEPIWSPAR